MKRILIAAAILFGVALDPGAAFAQCCDATDGSVAPPYQFKQCDEFFSTDQFQPKPPAGCGDMGQVGGPAGNCFGGSLYGKGCVCVNGTCFSDGSVGGGPAEATERECTRDAVAACCDAGHCSDIPGRPIGAACAGTRTGLTETPSCVSNCCLTVVPAPNGLGTGSGVCVSAEECNGALADMKPCSVDGNPLTFASNPKCDTGCCMSLIPNSGGVCVEATNCSS